MEFKDKLKLLRTQRGITQKQLADAIFVSRSAVAKWESGLGLPGEESMRALSDHFGVDVGHFTTEQPETVIVDKNRRIRRLSSYLIPLYVLLFLAFVTPINLFLAGYRFTSASAVDEYYHQFPVIRTADYDFYLNDDVAPMRFEAVKKYGPLYKKAEGSWKRLETVSGEHVGSLQCFEGRSTDYYFISYVGYVTDGGYDDNGNPYVTVNYKYRTDSIVLNGKLTELDFYCYFSSKDPIDQLQIKGELIVITDDRR